MKSSRARQKLTFVVLTTAIMKLHPLGYPLTEEFDRCDNSKRIGQSDYIPNHDADDVGIQYQSSRESRPVYVERALSKHRKQ